MWSLWLAGVVALFGVSCCAAAPLEKRGGVNFLSGQWSQPAFGSAASEESLRAAVKGAGVNWVALTWCHYQRDVHSTGPIYARASTPTREQLGAMVASATATGVKVFMRPCVDPDWSNPATKGTWRGEIGMGWDSAQWTAWFDHAYTPFIVEQARLAQELRVPLFAVGMELEYAAATQPAHWHSTIARVREVYNGTLTYCANHGNEGTITFWPAVDEIAIDAYYSLGDRPGLSVAQLVAAWQPYVASLGKLAALHNTTVTFAEIGYCSVAGANMDPAHCGGALPVDLTAQQDLYEAFFQAIYPQPWFRGVFFWAWLTDNADGGPKNNGFTPRGKPAAHVMQQNIY